MGDVLTATQPPPPIGWCIHEVDTCERKEKTTILNIVKLLVCVASAARSFSVTDRSPRKNSSVDCKDVWHQHFSIAPTEDGKQFSQQKLNELIALLPISRVEELEDCYFDDSRYSYLADNRWVRARSRPGQGTRWIERNCHNDEHNRGLELEDRELQNPDALRQIVSTELASFKFTRYTLDCRGAGYEGLSILLDVVAVKTDCFIIVGTVSLPQSSVHSECLPDECDQFLQRLNDVILRPVPSKVVQVLSIVASENSKIASELTKLSLSNLHHYQHITTNRDPLGYYKLDAKLTGEEWFKKVQNGYFLDKGYEPITKHRGYALSVLTLNQLRTLCPEAKEKDNERLIVALRMSTQFRFPQLAQALRKAPEKLDEFERLLIEQLSVEDLQYYGNVSAVRARKMSEACQFDHELPAPETSQYFGADARQSSYDDDDPTAARAPKVEKPTAAHKKKAQGAAAKKKTSRRPLRNAHPAH